MNLNFESESESKNYYPEVRKLVNYITEITPNGSESSLVSFELPLANVQELIDAFPDQIKFGKKKLLDLIELGGNTTLDIKLSGLYGYHSGTGYYGLLREIKVSASFKDPAMQQGAQDYYDLMKVLEVINYKYMPPNDIRIYITGK